MIYFLISVEKIKMEEEEKDTIINIDSRNNMKSISNPSIYRSIQSNLNNADSQQTVYYSVRNTVYEDVISLDSVDGAGDRNYYESENSTLRGTHETLIDDNYHNVRIQEQKPNPRVDFTRYPRINFNFKLILFDKNIFKIDFTVARSRRNES